MKHLIRVLYISKATSAFGPADIPGILEKSTANNAARGITGVLCYRGGYFAQILEGEELPVLETYTRIARDERHTDLVIIHVATTTKQLFENWAMGGIAEELNPFIDVRDILRLRNSPGERAGATGLMQRWLEMLNTQSGTATW